MREYLSKLQLQQDFSQKDLEYLFNNIISNEFSDIEVAAFLFGLSIKGESVEEIYSLIKILRSKAKKFENTNHEYTIDVCGTGGDGHNTLNISTAVSFVLSACDVRLVKHGNRAVSSKSGSSDVLQKLGINILADESLMQECLAKYNFCFLYAPNYHPAIKSVAKIRQSLKVRTIFNQIGPLLNPANLKKQLIGVYDKNLMNKYADILLKLNYKHAYIVNSDDGLDEISIAAKSNIIEIYKGKKKSFSFDPHTIIKQDFTLDDLKGGDAEYNAKAMIDLFAGKEGAYHEAVCLNAAFALNLTKNINDIDICYKLVKEKLLKGEIYQQYEEIKNFFYERDSCRDSK